MFLLLGEERIVGPISVVHSHQYCAKKIVFFERAHNFHHLIDNFYRRWKLICEG